MTTTFPVPAGAIDAADASAAERPGRLRPDRDALRDVWPMVLGVGPFGLLIGVTIGRTHRGPIHLDPALGLGSAVLYFGGSAHIAVLTLLQAGAGPLAVLATVLVVNARLALYGAALAPRFADQPGWFRWLAPQVLVDQLYAVATARPDLHGTAFRRYWITAGGAFAVGWLGSNAAGLLLGPVLPEHSRRWRRHWRCWSPPGCWPDSRGQPRSRPAAAAAAARRVGTPSFCSTADTW